MLTHILATAWGGFQIQHTAVFRSDFNRLTTNGACLVNLLPSYWKERGAAEIPSLVLNVVALFLSAFLSWRLVKACDGAIYYPRKHRRLTRSLHSSLDGKRSSALVPPEQSTESISSYCRCPLLSSCRHFSLLCRSHYGLISFTTVQSGQ